MGSWSCGWELWLGAVAESCGWGLSMVTLQDSSCMSIGAFVGGDAFEDGTQGHVGGEL